jgi:hypothetical protein
VKITVERMEKHIADIAFAEIDFMIPGFFISLLILNTTGYTVA